MILSRKEEIKVGDFCRIKYEKELISDKMTSKYSNKIFEVIKVKTNSLVEQDSKGEKLHCKKKWRKNNEKCWKNKELKEQEKVNKISKIARNSKKAGIPIENIIKSCRVRENPVKIDLYCKIYSIIYVINFTCRNRQPYFIFSPNSWKCKYD